MQLKRPVLAFALTFAAGIMLAWLFFMPVFIFLMPVGIAALLVPFKRYANEFRIIACGLGLGALFLFAQVSILKAEPMEGSLTGKVCSIPAKTGGGYYYYLNSLKLDGRKVPGRARLHSKTEFEPGTVLTMHAKLNLPKLRRNPGGNDQRVTLYSRYAKWSVSASGVEKQGESIALMRPIYSLRKGLLASIDAQYQADEAATMKGMLFGETGDMNEEWVSSFFIVGIGHIFSVSGLHVGIIAAALAMLLRRLPNKISSVIIVAFLLLYAALSAFTASVMRSLIMTAVALYVRGEGEKPDLLTTIGAAAIIILAADPMQLFGAGFALSFSAVLGIALFEEKFSAGITAKLPDKPVWRYIASSIGVSLAASLGIIPVQVLCFGTVNLLSVFANVFAVPLSSAAIIIGMISTLLGVVYLPLGMPLAFAATQLIRFNARLSLALAEVPFAQVAVGSSAILAVFLLCVLMAVYFKGKMRSAAIGAGIAMLIAFTCQSAIKLNTPTLTVLDVGQGNAVFVSYRGANVLIDGGNNIDGYDNGKAVVLPFLRNRGIGSLDAVIATHPHSDHVGGLSAVVRELNVGRLYTNGRYEQESQYDELLLAAESKNLMPSQLKKGSVLEIGDLEFEVLHPDGWSVDKLTGNEASLVIKLKCNGKSIILTGDAGKKAEAALEGDLNCDVLLVGHHGSPGASGEEFLKKTLPEYAIISSGVNTYGHPAEEVLARLGGIGAKILRTDKLGAITVKLKESVVINTCIGEANALR